MQRFVYFVTVFALSVAKDVSVYNPSEYYNRDKPELVYDSAFPWMFGFNSSSRLNIEIRYRNKPPDLTVVSVSYETGEEHIEVPRNVSSYKALSDGLEVFKFKCNLNDTALKINVQIQNKSNNCAKTVVKTTKRNKTNKKEYKNYDICLKDTACVLVVDLKNFECHERKTQKPTTRTKATTKAPKAPHKDKVTETTNYTSNVTSSTIVTQKTKSPVIETSTDLEKNHNALDSIVTSPPPVNIVTMANSRADKTKRKTQKPKIMMTTVKTFTGLENYHSTTKVPKAPHKDKVTETTNYTAHVTSPTIVTQKTKSPVIETSTDLEKNHNAVDSIVTSPPPVNIVTMANSRADKTETAEQQPPPILIYVLTTVIVVSVITLVVFIIVKKHRHRNTQPVDTLDLDTYATRNEVIYADLSLAQGDSKPPRRQYDQESPYAQIIGVMRPVDANFK